MANIINEKSIGLSTSSNASEKQNSGHVFSLRRLPSIATKATLSVVFSLLCLFLFVYCQTLPENTKNTSDEKLEKPVNEPALSSTQGQPAVTPELKDEPVEAEQIFENLETIRNLDYPDETLQGVFWRESDFGNRVYLTFDDGPNFEKADPLSELTVTESILDTLKRQNLNAAFFINGKNLEYRNDDEKRKKRLILKRLLREGNLLGNHSYHHYNLAKGIFVDGVNDLEETGEEFLSTQRALDDILGFHYPLILTRPPYAEPGRTDKLDSWLKQKKYYLISLQFDSYDYAYSETGKWNYIGILGRVDSLLKENSSGGVILLHELESTAKFLPDLIEKVIPENGNTVSTLENLLKDKYGRKS